MSDLRDFYINEIQNMMLSLRLEGMYSNTELEAMTNDQLKGVFDYLGDLWWEKHKPPKGWR